MSTRQLRLNTQDQIRKRLKEFIGKKINIVLNDGTVVLVLLQQCDELSITAKNMRLKKITFPLEKINEVYFDTKE
jgi:hypothetical protein